jgi:hypothetical protein
VLAWTRRAERFTCLAEARVFELQAGIALNA